MPDPKITITNLSVQFAERGSGSPLPALEAMNLTIGDGEFVCLVGPSGCGKTTLLRVLAGLQPPSSGTFTIQRNLTPNPSPYNGEGSPNQHVADDRVGTSPSLRSGAGDREGEVRPLTAMVFQGVTVFPWLTVLDNVAYGLRAKGMPYAERNRIAREWIGRVGLERFSESYPHELSGGMQQRVGLARAFAYNPEVLLMDEPFGALDEQTRLLLQETLLDLWQSRRMTILFVTHSVDEALTLADKVVVLSARPARVLSEATVTLPRPRDVLALRSDPRFGEMFGQIWGLLRAEVRTVESIR